MSYASTTDLDVKWGRENVDIAAWDNDAQARSITRVVGALASASAIIDGYLARRYTLPLALATNGALLLSNICADLAMGLLASAPGTRNETIIEAVKNATDFLRDVASGKAAIAIVTPPSALPEISPNEAVMLSEDRQFSRNRLRGL